MGFSISESEEVTLISSRGAVLCSLWRPVALVPGKFSLMDFFSGIVKDKHSSSRFSLQRVHRGFSILNLDANPLTQHALRMINSRKIRTFGAAFPIFEGSNFLLDRSIRSQSTNVPTLTIS